MNSEIVYQVAKALPLEEQLLLFEKLKKDFMASKKVNKNRNLLLTKEDALQYLMINVFSKNDKNS
jgi:hypothetical protein